MALSLNSLHDDRNMQPPVLEMALLGQPEVFYGTQRLVFRTQKALALLIYLVVTGTPQPRSHLAALLWPDREEARARATLRSTLRLVREAMALVQGVHSKHTEEEGSLIRGGRDRMGRESLWLQPGVQEEAIILDLQAIERAANLASRLHAQRLTDVPDHLDNVRRQLEAAAERCRGQFLAGFTLKDAPDFVDWIEQQRTYWQGRVDRVLDALSALQRRQGAFAAAIQTAELWINVNPLSEEANCCLIESRAAAGDRTAALAAYANYSEMLARVLGIGPAPETIALAERLRSDASPADPSSGAGQERQRLHHLRSNKQRDMETPLVGREVEFGALVAAYERARESVQVVIVEGEAGIGKTRLVEEFLRWAANTRGAIILGGRAYETGGRLPYQPLVEALRARLESERAPEDLLEDVWLMELSRILPELRERYPDLPVPASEGSEARGRLFEAAAQFGKALLHHHKPDALEAPLILFLDDLHWADVGTRDLLWFLCRRWGEDRCPALVVLAVRLEEVSTSGELRDWLHSLDRAAQIAFVILGMLDSTMTHELVRQLFGDTQHLQQMARWFYTETGGQPLYFVQTLRALQEQQLVIWEDGEAASSRLAAPAFEQELARFRSLLPSSMRAVIRERLERLTPTTRKLLMAGSVLGTRFQPVHAWKIADLDELTGLDALEEAERHLVVRELEGGEVCVFTHDRLREVAYTETGEARRRLLHRRAFELLERNKAPAAELAQHALKAGLVGSAFHYNLAAGDAAFAILAVHSAIAHYEQAWSLLEDFLDSNNQFRWGRQFDTKQQYLPQQFEPPARDREQLYIQLGRAYEWIGALEQAQNAYTALRAYAREGGVLALEGAALNRLAAVAWQHSWDFATAHALLNEALLLVEKTGSAAAIAETEWNLGQLAHWAGEFAQALTHAHRALELASAAKLDELVARSLFLVGRSHNIAGEWDEAIDPVIKSRVVYEALANENERGRAVSKASGTSAMETWELGTQFLWTGTPPASLPDYRARESYSLDLLAMSSINLGEPREGIELAREGLRLASAINNATAQVLNANKLQIGLVEVGEYEEALHTAREAADLIQTTHDPILRWLQLFTLADAQNMLFQLEEARVILDEAMTLSEMIPIGHWKSAIISRVCMNRVLTRDWPAATAAAQRSIAIRDALPAKLIWLDFHRYYETVALLHGGNAAIAREDVSRFGERVGNNRRFRLVHLRMQAMLASFEGRNEEAILSLEKALQIASEVGLPGEEWQIRAQFAGLHRVLGQEVQAEHMQTRAIDGINALATRILDAQLRMSFLNAAQRILLHPESNLW
jgi:DNA-binding SARP family transcriptional activator